MLAGEIEFGILPEDVRFDAEYHVGVGAKERESFRKRGNAFKEYFSRITHPGEFPRLYESSGYLFLRAQNVRPGRIEVDEPVYVSEKIYQSLPDAKAGSNDLLLVRTGANVGDCAPVSKQYVGALVSSHTLRLISRP